VDGRSRVAENPAPGWEDLLRAEWGIAGTLTTLEGEYDLNLRVTTPSGVRYVLKVMREGCAPEFVDLLCAVHAHLESADATLPVPRVVRTRSGRQWCSWRDEQGSPRLAWLLSHLPGAGYDRFRPRSLALGAALGAAAARLDRALATFAHPALERPLKWDLCAADWVADSLHLFDEPQRRALVARVMSRYEGIAPGVRALPRFVVHNDLNDANVLLARGDSDEPVVTGLIDFGDILRSPRVAEVAIAGTYLLLGHSQPERLLAAMVAAYHAIVPLSPDELDLVWPLVLTRLAVSVTNAAQQRRDQRWDAAEAEGERLAWDLLDRSCGMPERLVSARLRAACGVPATTASARVRDWLERTRGTFAPIMGRDLSSIPTGSLAVATSLLPRDPTAMSEAEARTLGAAALVGPEWVGSYGEPRAVYTAPAFRRGAHPIADRRSVHLGVDIFLPAGSPVCAPCDAVVEVAQYRDASLDYGGMVVLRHVTPEGDPFWTLYGHLARNGIAALEAGQSVPRGTCFATLGPVEENGGWDPHLHLQLALTTDGMETEWPGVADPDDLALWLAVCPNPAALLNLADAAVAYRPIDVDGLLVERRARFASNLSLSYRVPCLFVRGWRHYLFDEWGRTHLDAYNNVPHVGHAHPRLAAVAADQLARLNSNTRYLHPAQLAFATALLARMPGHLTHVFLVNSGSEANELALRLARTHTGARDMITGDHGYHGHTTGAFDVSPYKFDKPGGGGRPDWVQVVPAADTYRGPHRDADAAARYVEYVDAALARIADRGAGFAGFIAETFPSVAGQLIPPDGYLRDVYARVRSAGGVTIADEVQTGLGRLGDWFWAFEQQGVSPDIVVLGKPLGNGHPIGAVVTTSEIARSFDNGIEFFSTFGGSTLSCRVGLEVLRIVEDEGLQENARRIGTHLLDGLRQLQSRYTAIGDVRGMGLFVGVELVTDRDARRPDSRLARYVVNRLRDERILIGSEGPADNVLKIRPPLTIGRSDVDCLLEVLGRVLGEGEELV